MRKVIASWSGGKDSCLACYKAINAGFEVRYLFNTISREFERVNFHGLSKDLLRSPAEAVLIPLYQIKTTPDGYTGEFKEAVDELIEKDGISGMVFGDIYLEEHKQWINEVCADLGIEPIMPLWGRKSEEVIGEFIDCGFKAVVVGVWTKNINNGEEWVGRRVDQEFVDYVKNYGNIDLCGENGEYHTLVTDGPLFKKRIEIFEPKKVYREQEYDGKVYGNWFLDIKRFRVCHKISASHRGC